MPLITQISMQKRREHRRSIFLDGSFAFGCNLNVVARFRLREGMKISESQLREIQIGEVKQECFDKAMRYLQTRLHSRAELERKLKRQEWGDAIIAMVLDDLARMNYLDDARFATTKAQSLAEHKKHGKRRAFVELIKAGVKRDVATKALEDVYEPRDSMKVARELAQKQRPRLMKLEPQIAKRRLFGMLMRRGFEYDEIKPVVEEVLGSSQAD